VVFGGGEDVGGVVVVVDMHASGAVLLRGGEVGVAVEGLALVYACAHLIEEVFLLGYGRFFELGNLADWVAEAAFHAHRGLGEAAAERRLVHGRPVAEFVGVLRCLEFLALVIVAEVVFD